MTPVDPSQNPSLAPPFLSESFPDTYLSLPESLTDTFSIPPRIPHWHLSTLPESPTDTYCIRSESLTDTSSTSFESLTDTYPSLPESPTDTYSIRSESLTDTYPPLQKYITDTYSISSRILHWHLLYLSQNLLMTITRPSRNPLLTLTLSLPESLTNTYSITPRIPHQHLLQPSQNPWSTLTPTLPESLSDTYSIHLRIFYWHLLHPLQNLFLGDLSTAACPLPDVHRVDHILSRNHWAPRLHGTRPRDFHGVYSVLFGWHVWKVYVITCCKDMLIINWWEIYGQNQLVNNSPLL